MAATTTMGVQEAYDALDKYARTYSRLPLLLLMHAAVPQSFRADLLNLIKLNFLPEAGADLTVDADVLFSPLTEATGGGYFRLDVEVRRHCLALLNAAYSHEPEPRTRRVGRFLMTYAEHIERRSVAAMAPLLSEFLEVQRWVALAFVDPEAAAGRFAEAIKATDTRQAVTRLRLGSLTAAMSIPLSGHQEIISYARGLDALMSGDRDRGRSIMKRLSGRSLEIGGISLVPASEMLDRFRDPSEPRRHGSGERETPARPSEPTPFRDPFQDESIDGPEMLWLPGGTFTMGDGQGIGGAHERPVHPVALDAFAIGRVPVTVGDYLRFCEDTRKHWPEWLEEGSEYHIEKGTSDWYSRRGMSRKALDLPIVGISWKDAASYCEWLSEQTGERYELPTEAEWEYACRAGSETAYCFGDDQDRLGDYAWYDKNAGGKVQPAGKKQANGFGLHDMHGNVWEWVGDWYSESYYKQLASTTPSGSSGSTSSTEQPSSENPSGPEQGSLRVIRGGAWNNDADYCRSAYRVRYDPGFRGSNLGFRLSRKV